MFGMNTHYNMGGLKMPQIEIIQGNALDLLSQMPDESVDLIIADPPYNLGKDYGTCKDLIGFNEYLKFSEEWLSHSHRLLKGSGTLFVFMGVRFVSYLFDILDRKLGMAFNSWISWHYTQGMGKRIGFSPRHDDILMFNKSEKFYFNLDPVRVPQKYYRTRNNMRGANPGDVWQFSHVHYCHPNRKDHPTQKPEGLIERMVLASSREGDSILDPFSGSGTTLRVCQQLDRNCVGIELNPQYVEMAKERLGQPFSGFDSIDPRMERVPLDLRDKNIRSDYLKNHIHWFLSNHENSLETFGKVVKEMYDDIRDLN